LHAINGFTVVCCAAAADRRSPLTRLWATLTSDWEPLIEETFCMSMQSHLAELEKKHQALEAEIDECLTHPAVDDLRIVELKRKKLQVKDEIERLRHDGSVSVH
jgi:hypothetical protein